ncbi:amino acid ABC transporter ATP-binding protein [uncultured Cohaesibacter sp.]|uniref:amino acid ABC transporter ATP-binding protein n=1 Tax=uncultured Cohaesibacter sp. TaxID=1002546 RepID=UPI0029C76A2B|nr:amino acid ABC transporter ATP-binding protein [uncultured Cohaesibacter sp.]
MAKAAITIEGLNKFYDGYHALKDIDLRIEEGKTVVICGPSGSGKSTLIRCMNGLEELTSGTLKVLDFEIGDDSTQLLAVRKRVGMVFQSFNLFPHMSVLENCILPQIRSLGTKRDKATDEAFQQLQRMHVEEHAEKYPDQLSGGQQQRVALARALCLKPEVMLFDEPTSALDPEMIAEVLDTMQALARDDMTIVCVTHEMGFARAVADEVIFMADGSIIESGPPDQMFSNPKHQITRDFFSAVER